MGVIGAFHPDEQLHGYVASQLSAFRGDASVRLATVTSGAVLAALFRELVTLGTRWRWRTAARRECCRR